MKPLKYIISISYFVVQISFGQSVNLNATASNTNSLEAGDVFLYTLEAEPNTPFNGLQVNLHYNHNLIRPVQLTPQYDFDAILQHDIETPGVVKFAAGNLGSLINNSISVLQIAFEVLNHEGTIEISHQLSNYNATQVTNQNGENLLGQTNTITLERLSVNNVELNNYIKIYPNPIKHTVNIDLNGLDNALKKVVFYTLAGKQISTITHFNIKNHTATIPISKILNNGMYFMHVITHEDTKTTFKIIVNR